MTEGLICVSCTRYLFECPVQCRCGDRLCSTCFKLLTKNENKFSCPKCYTVVSVDKCFRDRAATIELEKAIIPCNSKSCSWKGSSKDYQEHIKNCKFAIAFCPYQGLANEIEEHCATSTKKHLLEQLMAISQHFSDLRSEVNHMHRVISVKMQHVLSVVSKAETTIQSLQEKLSDQTTIVQSKIKEYLTPYEECINNASLQEPGSFWSQPNEQDVSGVFHSKSELVLSRNIKLPVEMSVSHFMLTKKALD